MQISGGALEEKKVDGRRVERRGKGEENTRKKRRGNRKEGVRRQKRSEPENLLERREFLSWIFFVSNAAVSAAQTR